MTRNTWTDSDEIKKLAAHIAQRTSNRVALTTWSPGDGVTRYRLGIMDSAATFHDYFGDRALTTANGRSAALAMCRAFLDGANEGNTVAQ